MIHNFDDELKKGKEGENRILRAFQSPDGQWYLRRVKGYGPDFFCPHTGEFVELKTDYYRVDETPNFFIERFGDEAERTLGGPWKARADSCSLYLYYFILDNTLWSFPVHGIIEFMEAHFFPHDLINVRNHGYITKGWKVNRNLLVSSVPNSRGPVTPGWTFEACRTVSTINATGS
jgi:hypothetical protein